MHYLVHICVIWSKIKTQKSQREIDLFTGQPLFFHFKNKIVSILVTQFNNFRPLHVSSQKQKIKQL